MRDTKNAAKVAWLRASAARKRAERTEVRVYDKNGNWVSSYYMCTGSAAKPAPAVTDPGVIGTVPLEPATQPSKSRVPTGVIQPLTPSTASPVG